MSYMEKQFELLPCPKCLDKAPQLYAEGNATKLIFEDGSEEFYFSEPVGYICECFECGTCTEMFLSKESAIHAWNSRDIKDCEGKAFYD